MLRYGGILTRNSFFNTNISLKIKHFPRELSTPTEILISSPSKIQCSQNFHTNLWRLSPVASKDTEDVRKLKIQNLFNDNELQESIKNDAIKNNKLSKTSGVNDAPSPRTVHHVRLKDKYSIADIERMYKHPKAKIHEIYQTVGNQVPKTCVNYEFQKAGKNIDKWCCTVSVTWPEELLFSAIANTKLLAAHSASLKLLHHLENEKKLRDGKPIVFSGIDIKEQANKPVPLNITTESLEEVKFIVGKYETDIRDLLSKFEAEAHANSASSRHYESCFQTGAVIDPVGKSNPVNRLQAKIVDRNRVLQARYEDRILRSPPSDLPITDYRDQIIDTIESNQVVLIKGDTGCGKTTQVPQYIMDHFAKKSQATNCNILVAQPRRISAISLAERIADERKEQVGDVVGFQVRLSQELPNTPAGILFCTTGILLRKLQFNPKLEGCSHVIVDEAHERTINTDMLLALLKRAVVINKDLKVIIMSATINAELFQNYFNCKVIEVPGRVYPVEAHYLEDIDSLGLQTQNSYSGMLFDDRRPITTDVLQDTPNIDLVKMGELIVWITKNKPPGAILCFLPGWAEISQMRKYLEEYSVLSRRKDDVMIVPLHSKMAHYDQRKIFDTPPPHVRKIVLATDIAETGITVTDVVYVVDSCTHRQLQWHEKLGISSIKNQWASQANINQRKGRAGRVQPGVSYHFVTREMFNNLLPHPIPEIKRSSLEKTVLDGKTYSSNEKALEFFGSVPEPPAPVVIEQAVRDLVELGALDHQENLTPLGKRIAFFTVQPRLSKALLYSSIFNCVSPMLTISAAMAAESDIFTGVLQNKQAVRDVKKQYHPTSDHTSLVWLYQQWLSYANAGKFQARDFCFKSRLYPERMYTLNKVRELYGEHLLHAKMIDCPKEYHNLNENANEYAELDEMVRGVLLSGVDQVIYQRDFEIRNGLLKKGSSTFVTENGTRVSITPDSVNFKRKKWPSPYLTYVRSTHSEERRMSLVRECSMVSPLTVFLFSQAQVLGYVHKASTGEDDVNSSNQILFMMKDRKNIRLLCNKETATMLLKFRDIMWGIVRYMVANQGLPVDDQTTYDRIQDYKQQLLQVLGKMLSESANSIDEPEPNTDTRSQGTDWSDEE
ncbi:putative ATP-dependent RNA helicase DHX30 [Fopius arisanus]|uniref:RNA helicase n=1 Tax=Fopius arisanus TaxID=64838 RepID=A0A9R1TZ13_9HYME|nr:PREDICTED: putative ATP-dependent RNA helicase DHX30 [Fopius arisanus]